MNPRKTFSKVESPFSRRGYPRGINTDRKAERARRRYNCDTFLAGTSEKRKRKETTAENKRGDLRNARGLEGLEGSEERGRRKEDEGLHDAAHPLEGLINRFN